MYKKGLLWLLLAFSPFTFADDKAQLNQLLEAFLANTVQDDLKNHQRFWAEDLIYTSSAGKRFGKQSIIDGIKEAEAAKAAEQKASSTKPASDNTEPTYWAEETDIRVYDDIAIVAFKLGAKWKESGETRKQFYFNTGTFQKRQGMWKVIAWQATKIPAA